MSGQKAYGKLPFSSTTTTAGSVNLSFTTPAIALTTIPVFKAL